MGVGLQCISREVAGRGGGGIHVSGVKKMVQNDEIKAEFPAPFHLKK